MQGERNLLHVYVLPILELRCRSIYVKVDLVDLRWGVRSAEMGSGQVENCIQQVLAADLFIGILGERYGWIPPQQEHRNLPFTQGNGSTIDKKEVSITEIEIEVGALQRVNSHRDRCFFYFRDPEFLKTVPETARYNFTTQSAEDRKKLADLKARIKSSGLEVNEGYRAKYGGRVRGEHIAGNLQEFGDRVVENLWNSISNLYPPSIISSIHSIQALQQNQLSACSELAGSFIGRKREMKSVQRCIDKALANEVYGSIVRVLSPAGSGCTALLQMLTHTYRVEGLDVISYILDEKDMEENQREFLEYILYSLDGKPNRVQDVAELNLTIQQKIKKSKGKLLIIINRMDILGCIDWIPEMLPPGLIILTSCSPENKKCLQQFSSLQDVKLGQMDLKDRKDYVRSRLGVLGKTLNEDSYENQIDDLVSRREGGSPAWLNAAINRLVKFSSYNTISQDIRGLGNSMKELYLQQLSTAVDSCGEEAVSTAVRIIYLSKYGIHLSDLQALMSFLLYGELSKLSSIENTLIQFKQFRAKSEYIFPTLDLCTLLNQLDGVIVYISGVYTHPAGMVRKLLWEKFIRSTDPRSIKVLQCSLAALYNHILNRNTDSRSIKVLLYSLAASIIIY
ncbi:telomerase protein component 1 isoform X3 [Eurytemora carolleeae]|uniref:telomerase protein component 1 isoform X3 n=1 Tax=Eurytemora carolleeae TaxID=1294199 RepID=UPI000C787501|nr:telomerase protein component 1 isoform X3 [Eurytemora carolleeae]|eukprot:XP_023346336.1 telomerase protein component 1-like isoform X3 [Eurytemora affinis]